MKASLQKFPVRKIIYNLLEDPTKMNHLVKCKTCADLGL